MRLPPGYLPGRYADIRLGSLCLLALVAVCLLARAPIGMEPVGGVLARLGLYQEQHFPDADGRCGGDTEPMGMRNTPGLLFGWNCYPYRP